MARRSRKVTMWAVTIAALLFCPSFLFALPQEVQDPHDLGINTLSTALANGGIVSVGSSSTGMIPISLTR